MTTRNMLAAFVVTGLLVWSQFGGVAQAQREPIMVERPVHQAHAATAHRADVAPTIDVDAHHGPRRNPARIFGFVLTPIGALGIGGGIVLAVIGSLVEHPLCWSDSCSGHDASGYFVGAGISAGAGLLALIAGISLIRGNPTWDEANVPNVRVALAPTDGGALASIAVDF